MNKKTMTIVIIAINFAVIAFGMALCLEIKSPLLALILVSGSIPIVVLYTLMWKDIEKDNIKNDDILDDL